MRAPFYPPCHALVSGGKDSLSAAQCLADHDRLIGCVALDTGISTPDWKDAVSDNCKRKSWPLTFYKTTYTYEDLVLKYGFPGPQKHSWFMRYLKGRAVEQFAKTYPGQVLASGVRSAESTRRALTTKPVGMFEKIPILAPIYDWTTKEAWDTFRASGFERPPAYAAMQISGDCLCGAYARDEEAQALAVHYPAVWKRIEDLQRKAKALHPTRWRWGWAKKADRRTMPNQISFFCAECSQGVS
jgi:3'-phosphoadenosine 5'-phosphosulfate sulfotransferase (PAPS reductase)/FAD synthetase